MHGKQCKIPRADRMSYFAVNDLYSPETALEEDLL